MSEEKSIPDNLDTVKELLAKRKLVEDLVHRQKYPRTNWSGHGAQTTHPAGRIRCWSASLDRNCIHYRSAWKPEERLLVWNEVREERGEAILEILSDEIREDLICDSHLRNERPR